MIKINLLPFKKKRVGALKNDLIGFLILLLAAVAVFSYYQWRLHGEIDEVKMKISAANKESQKLQPYYGEYMQIQAGKQEIQKRIKTLTQLEKGRALVARSLYDISSVIKEGVWVKSFKKTDNKFEIEGRSLVNESISEFMESLSKMAYISGLELKNIQDVTEEGLTIKKFIITGNMSI